MDHLNFFMPFQSLPQKHEDQLTRAYLVVLKLVPIALSVFVDLVRSKPMPDGNEIPPITEMTMDEVVWQTQVTRISQTKGRLVSIAITDADRPQPPVNVKDSDRGARYDGVLSFKPDWIFVLENKPHDAYGDDANRQMHPNLGANSEVVVEPVGIKLSWREIIERLVALLQRQLVQGAEWAIVDDFLGFVDECFPHLNPFTTLDICKDNEHLLGKRCRNIMEQMKLGDVSDHKGWKPGIKLNSGAMREVSLYPEDCEIKEWRITLGMSPGDTVTQARKFFGSVKETEFLSLVDRGWTIAPNLHFAFMSTNLVWASRAMPLGDYITFWLNSFDLIRRETRDERGFRDLFQSLCEKGLISEDNISELESKFTNTNRNHVNICPGLNLSYCWPRNDACELDKKGKLVDDVKSRVLEALATWNQTLV